MRRISYRPFVVLALVLFTILSLPHWACNNIRSAAVATLAPPWRALNFFKTFGASPLTVPHATSREVEVLKQENYMMHAQIEMLRHFLKAESLMEKELERLGITTNPKRKEELLRLVDMQAQSLFARVIFREPVSWSSSLWINVGERNNKILGKNVVAKNSPVVLGTSAVGVVEYVGYRRSRVRLISDSGLTPSVRVVRGGEQNRAALEHIDAVLDDLSQRGDFREIYNALSAVKKTLLSQTEAVYLAKGELAGNSAPLWRGRGALLHGVGFNYDFADDEGPGRLLHASDSPLVREGDLLVTTGMDGVFPSGLRVGLVCRVEPLREGASAYELEAKIAAGNLDELSYVSVFPPLEAD